MKRFLKPFVLLLCVLLLLPTLFSCVNWEQRKAEADAMFQSFDNSRNYVFFTLYELHIGERVIPIKNLRYGGQVCNLVFCTPDGVFAYVYDTTFAAKPATPNFHIVLIDYETLQMTLMASVYLPDEVINTGHYQNKLYFRYDPGKDKDQRYLVYDIATQEISYAGTNNVGLIENPHDHNRSQRYTFSDELLKDLTLYQLRITDKQTNKVFKVNKKLLDTCKEGKQILKTAPRLAIGGMGSVYEKDGKIYIPMLYEVGFLGSPCYWFIVIYDPNTNTMEYYTSIYFEEYPEGIFDLYIP
ncbi:MAG: hypothetical protein IJW29_00775 [Clostridia bacterium]|nr:hypothetical protein [Clostridia bacterium]